MAKSKFIEDEMSRQYKINYAALLAELNPKPSAEILEKLRKQYIDRRKETSVSITAEAKY
jgi:hypothetical protein